MGSSGLIYAAIVAAWGAVLIPRWLRRGEEVDQAREEDQARGVRVLAEHDTDEPSTRRSPGSVRSEQTAPWPAAMDDVDHAARRRRRVIAFLALTLVGTATVAVIELIPLWSVTIPTALLAVFVSLARRAANEQARRAARRRRHMHAPAEPETTPAGELQQQSEIPAPVDPDAWEPVPVPLPTYLLKPKAEPVVRRIDLSPAGAWTSNRLAHVAAHHSPTRTDEYDVDATTDVHTRAVGN